VYSSAFVENIEILFWFVAQAFGGISAALLGLNNLIIGGIGANCAAVCRCVTPVELYLDADRGAGRGPMLIEPVDCALEVIEVEDTIFCLEATAWKGSLVITLWYLKGRAKARPTSSASFFGSLSANSF
jgi:hypothetical protein